MNQNVQNHIDETVAELRALFVKAATRIEAIRPGEKIPATALAEELAKELGMTQPQLYPTLKFLFDKYPGVEIRRGAHGGIYRPLPNMPVTLVPGATADDSDTTTTKQP